MSFASPTKRAVPRLFSVQVEDAAALDEVLHELKANAAVLEVLPLCTCQRCELFVLGSDKCQTPASLVREGRSFSEGADAATRLFEIAAGALSDIPGELAIAEQVRRQLRIALKAGHAGSILAGLTRRALRAGEELRERVRCRTPILELPELVVRQVQHLAAGLGRPPRIALLGSGMLGRSLHASLQHAGMTPTNWASRHISTDEDAPSCTLEEAMAAVDHTDVLIAVLGGLHRTLDASLLPRRLTTIDLGVPANLARPMWTYSSLVKEQASSLEAQRKHVAAAAHRLRAKAESALAETLCPMMAGVNRSIARFRQTIVDAELNRLSAMLESLSESKADELRRSIRHTATRCMHPLHSYVNALGRQGRAEDAASIVDHLLSSRVGWSLAESFPGDAGKAVPSPFSLGP